MPNNTRHFELELEMTFKNWASLFVMLDKGLRFPIFLFSIDVDFHIKNKTLMQLIFNPPEEKSDSIVSSMKDYDRRVKVF